MALLDLGEVVGPALRRHAGFGLAEGAEDQGALDPVAQLSGIARPGIGLEALQHACGDRQGRQAELRRELLHEHPRERLDVVDPLAQRRQVDAHDVEPVIEVGAELPGRDPLGEVGIGGGDEAHVDRDLAVRAHGADLAVLDHPQELRLERERQLGDLVEEERAPLRVEEQPLPRGGGAREGALHVAEQLALDDVRGDRPAIDRHERPVGEGGLLVERARRDLLGGARFTRDQHGAPGRRGARHHVAHARHLRRGADDAQGRPRARRRPELAAEHEVLLAQGRPVEAAHDRVEDLLGAERLEHEIGRPRPHGLDRGLEIGEGRDQDDVGEQAVAAQVREPGEPGAAAQDVVEDDEVEMARFEQPARGEGIAHRLDPGAARRERPHQEVAHARLVVDDEDLRLGEPWVGGSNAVVCGVGAVRHGAATGPAEGSAASMPGATLA